MKKVVEHEVRKAATAAAWACGHGAGNRGGTRGRSTRGEGGEACLR